MRTIDSNEVIDIQLLMEIAIDGMGGNVMPLSDEPMDYLIAAYYLVQGPCVGCDGYELARNMVTRIGQVSNEALQ